MVFRRPGQLVTLVGVEHDNDPAGMTFQLIDAAFQLAPVDLVIVEGTRTSLGPDPAVLRALAAEPVDAGGLQPNGETVPTVRGAIGRNATLLGGEPDETQVMERAAQFGVTRQDLVGFYTLRVVPQWLRDGSASAPMDPRLVPLIERQLARIKTMLGEVDTGMSTYTEWAAWYRRTNGREFGIAFDPEETGPLADGPWRTNRIAASIARARDTHLLRVIGSSLHSHRSVMVVYGGSHAMIVRSALERRFGPPCYFGNQIADLRRHCLT
jgi:hypothetical protein